MSYALSEQAAAAGWAFALGAVSGAFYDLLTVLRSRAGRGLSAPLTLVSDALFCIVTAGAFFLLGCGPGGGRLRLILLLFVLPGIILYFALLSNVVTKGLGYILNALGYICKILTLPFVILHKLLRNSVAFIKNNLLYLHKWFTIIKRFNI